MALAGTSAVEETETEGTEGVCLMAVLISIHPEWCEKIVAGQKTLEVRKSKPKLVPPFKCYIYCTKARKGWFRLSSLTVQLDGYIIGEFICDSIRCFDVPYPAFQRELDKQIMEQSCLTYYQLHRYAYHDALYGWRISDLVIYDKPKLLSSFNKPCPYKLPNGSRMDVPCPCDKYSHDFDEETGLVYCTRRMTKPPQSWCYVEEATP